MSMEQLDAATRAGAVSVFLLLAWLLPRYRRQVGLPALLFPPLAICVAGFAIGNTPLAALRPTGMAGDLADAVSGFTVIFLWWFCLSCFDRDFRPTGGVAALGLVWAGIAALDRGFFGAALADAEWSYVLVPLGFAIVGHLVFRLLTERRGDLIERRHDARVMVAVLLGGMLFVDLAADALFGFAWRPLAFAMVQNAMLLAFGLWLAGALLTVRDDVLTFGAGDGLSMPPIPIPRRHDGELYRRLSGLMETDRVFLDPELTLDAFVRRMGAPERAVRTLINRQLGYDHFRTFLNHYRVAEACRLLEDRTCEDKLVTVALESGFASLASFNRVFKAIQGCTPSAYRAAMRGDGPGETSHAAKTGF